MIGHDRAVKRTVTFCMYTLFRVGQK